MKRLEALGILCNGVIWPHRQIAPPNADWPPRLHLPDESFEVSFIPVIQPGQLLIVGS